MELVFKQSKAVAVTSMSFPHGDVNNFVVGSEDGSVYMACRHGRWVPPPKHRPGETVAAFLTHLGPSVNVAHSPLSVAQFHHSISCWLRFRSCPVILFFFSACQLCLQRSLTINRAHMRGETNHSFPVRFIFLLCVFLWAREFVYAWSSQGD